MTLTLTLTETFVLQPYICHHANHRSNLSPSAEPTHSQQLSMDAMLLWEALVFTSSYLLLPSNLVVSDTHKMAADVCH